MCYLITFESCTYFWVKYVSCNDFLVMYCANCIMFQSIYQCPLKLDFLCRVDLSYFLPCLLRRARGPVDFLTFGLNSTLCSSFWWMMSLLLMVKLSSLSEKILEFLLNLTSSSWGRSKEVSNLSSLNWRNEGWNKDSHVMSKGSNVLWNDIVLCMLWVKVMCHTC